MLYAAKVEAVVEFAYFTKGFNLLTCLKAFVGCGPVVCCVFEFPASFLVWPFLLYGPLLKIQLHSLSFA